MWIGFAIVLTINAELAYDVTPYATEKACRDEVARIHKDAQASNRALAWKLDCFDAQTMTPRSKPIEPEPDLKMRPAPAPRKPEPTT